MMLNIGKLVLSITIALGLASCKGEKSKYQSSDQITYTDTLLINHKTILDSCNIDTLIESIEVIPLQDSTGFLLGDIYKVFFTEDNIIVHDRHSSRQILLFNKEGSFIKRILGTGKGPDEALQIDDSWINEDGSVDAYDFAQKKIFHFNSINYDLDHYVNGKKGVYHNLLRVPDRGVFYAYAPFNANNDKIDEENFELSILNSELLPIKGVISFDKKMENVLMMSPRQLLYRYLDTIRFSKSYQNHIISFRNDSLVKATLIEYSKNPLTKDILLKIIDENLSEFRNQNIDPNLRSQFFKDFMYYYGNYNETLNHTYFTSILEHNIFHSLASKIDGSILNSRFFYETKYKLRLPTLISAHGDYLIGVMDTYYIDKLLLNGSSLEKYKNGELNTFLLVKIKLK